MIHDLLLEEEIAEESDFLKPEAAADEDVLRVHTSAWVNKVRSDTLTMSERMKLEIPLSKSTVNASGSRRADRSLPGAGRFRMVLPQILAVDSITPIRAMARAFA